MELTMNINGASLSTANPGQPKPDENSADSTGCDSAKLESLGTSIGLRAVANDAELTARLAMQISAALPK